MGATAGADPIRVGVIAEQTGPLSFVGLANANVARMVIGDINAKGGLVGRQLELQLEDGATDDAVAAAAATKLVEQDNVDVIFGGIYSSTRQAIQGPAVDQGKTLYIYPEQYEGGESDPLIFCTGPGPAQQIDRFIPWLMRKTGAKTFYFPSADYIWPHVLNERVRKVVTANGGSIVGEEYHPLDHMDYDATVERINASGAEVASRAGAVTSSARTSTRTSSTWCRPSTSRGSTAVSTTTRPSAIRSARSCWRSTTRSTPATRSSRVAARARASTAGCACGRPPWQRRARSCRRT